MKKIFVTITYVLTLLTVVLLFCSCENGENITPTEAPTSSLTQNSSELPTEEPSGENQQDATNDAVTHIHSFTERIYKEEYLKSEATCVSPAQYYYSCKCGMPGADAFSEGNINTANHAENVIREYSYIDSSSHKITKTCRECNVLINDENEAHGENCIICFEAGIYDSANNLLATWKQLVNNYAWDVEKSYAIDNPGQSDYYATATSSPYYIMKNTDGLENATKIVIPSNVDGIGKGAFYDCNKITSIAIQDSQNNAFVVAEKAFSNCLSLADIVFPNTLTHINDGAFAGCTKIKSVSIPNTIIKFGEGAFTNCVSLNEVHYDGTLDEWLLLRFESATEHPCINGSSLFINGEIVTELAIPNTAKVGPYAFYGCTSIVEISIPKGVRYIEAGAFMNCVNLESIKMHKDSVIEIKNKAFYDCISLKELEFSDTMDKLGEYAFYNCDSLEVVTLTENISSIGKYCFAECNTLDTVYFNIKYCKIPLDRTFVGCNSLASIEYGGTIEEWNKVRETYEVVRNENGIIVAGIYWDDETGEYSVNCTNGTITKHDIRGTRTYKSKDETT